MAKDNQLADWLSSSEREEGNISENTITFHCYRYFQDCLTVMNNHLAMNWHHCLFPRLPQNNPTITTSKYTTLVKGFLQELSSVRNVTQLLYLLEKYLWCVPAQTTNYVPDISLFDHAKTTAAIALCVDEQYDQGLLTTRGLKKMDKNDDHHWRLIKETFPVFRILFLTFPAKGCKNPKAHSVYISLLTDVISVSD